MRLNSLHSTMQGPVRKVFEAMEEAGRTEPWKPVLVYTLRSPQDQLDLWKRGRAKIEGRWEQTGRIVTRALPWQSAHCFGLAADVALVGDEDGHWLDDDHAGWLLLGKHVETQGLVWGGRWKFRDAAHMEARDWRDVVGVARIDRMREIWSL